MNRRDVLKTLSLGALLPALKLDLSAATASRSELPRGNCGRYRFRIGENDACALLCGVMDVRPAQPFFASEAPPDVFAAALREAAPAGMIRMPFNVLLLDWNGEYVLVDTGEPGGAGRSAPVCERLVELGLSPGQITHVIITHAHFDHVGGLLDEAGRPVFANARHHVLRAESDFWMAPKPDVSRMRFDATDMISLARRVFEKIRFHYVEPGGEILPGVTAFHTPGHTPGLMTLRFKSGQAALYHIADLSHHSRLLLEHPAWSVGSDIDPVAAAHSREGVFEMLAASGERVFGFHLPFPGVGCIVRTEGGFRWIPEEWNVNGT